MARKNYTDILLEDMNSKFEAILEVLVPMRKELTEVKETLAGTRDDVTDLKRDMKVVKMAVKVTNQDLQDYERRITALESA